jgi:hypothetical protein
MRGEAIGSPTFNTPLTKLIPFALPSWTIPISLFISNMAFSGHK